MLGDPGALGEEREEREELEESQGNPAKSRGGPTREPLQGRRFPAPG